MFLELAMTSVNYGDFLEETLPTNIPHFDRIVVATVPNDSHTKQVCSKFGVECVETNIFYKDGAFNKSLGLNYALAHLKGNHWTVIQDADISLPINYRRFLMNAELSTDCLYTVDRVNCRTREAWDEYKMNPDHQYWWRYLINPPKGWELGSRLSHFDTGGFCPLGYHQIFHADSGINRYPTKQGSAEHTDVLFSMKWERSKRILIPEIFAIHLESGKPPMGANWSGRKTPIFQTGDPKPYPVCDPHYPIITEGAPDYRKMAKYAGINKS